MPRSAQEPSPADGSHLHRYAQRFNAAEINSSFYKLHRPATYDRWAASVGPDFRFSVKVPKAITHEQRLVATDVLLDVFLSEATALGNKLGCLLVQLPPSLEYDAGTVESFLDNLRERYDGPVALEPRHVSWFGDGVAQTLHDYRVARVAADPAAVAAAAEPGGWPGVVYYRLHGSPDMYYSSYDEPYLDGLATRLRHATTRAREVWCIFDNTTLGAALPNALGLLDRLLSVAGSG